jgi:hypothetical protein
MRHKISKKISFTAGKAEKSFCSEKITSYTGLTRIWDYLCSKGVEKVFNSRFATKGSNSTKFLNVQILLSIVLANLSGVFRLSHIEKFTGDPLVCHLLNLPKQIDEDVFKTRLEQLGERGAHKLQTIIFCISRRLIGKHLTERVTIDCDSTEFTVYGNQQGAAKGYNPHKQGAKSYHPLLCFVSEMKIILNSWFRTGSAYTSNGIVEFMQQTLSILPRKVKKIFFRADSGFFNGELFDFLDEKGHEFLVKVKLKNLRDILLDRTFIKINSHEAICEFEYKAAGWTKARTMYAIRIVKAWHPVNFFGKMIQLPEHAYFCYCTNVKGLNAKQLHALYGARAESENWIEHTKNQLCAGKTITDNFYVNDILWQLGVLAYNLSIVIRYESDFKVWREEPATFRRWFICVAGKVVKSSRTTTVKMSKHYIFADRWQRFADKVPLVA